MNVFIYSLDDPQTGTPRYLGKAKNPNFRFSCHLSNSRFERTEKSKWITRLLESGLKPRLTVIDSVPDCEWEFWEQEYIRVFKALQFSLVNGTSGGNGGFQLSPEASARKREAMSRALKGRKFSPKTIEKMRLAALGRKHSEETKLKIGEKSRGKRMSQISRELIRTAKILYWQKIKGVK